VKAISARLQNKITSAETAGRVGMVELKTWFMASTNGLETSEILQRISRDPETIREGTSGQGRKQQAYKRSSASRQASQPQAKGLRRKPSLTREIISDPGYRRTFPLSRVQATRINVFCGCFTWKAIWWGEKRIL
tara:strand:- start:752 stop:1156 length:405 start_codon:yes stop_codon:yes gene_type:complete